MIKQYEITPMEFPFKHFQNHNTMPIGCPICKNQYRVRPQGQYVKVIGILRLCVWTCSVECAELYIWATI